MIDGLGALEVGGLRAGLGDDLSQDLRVLQHRAGLEHVLVKRLAVVIGHEQRALQRLENGLLADVRIRVVDEHAGIDVAVRVNVEVSAAARDASADVLAVVLEVHREEALRGAVAADAVDNDLSLLGRRQELGRSVVAHGHVVEVPHEERAVILHHLVILLRSDGVVVLARVAAGHAVHQPAVVHDLHGLQHALVDALAAAAVGRLLEAFEGDRGHEVLHAQHLVRELLVDQSAVREGEEHAVVMLLAETDDVLLPHQRLAAGVDVQVHAHLLTLADDVVDLVVGQVQLIAVLGRPAAHALQVAGRGRIQQDGPRDVASVLRAHLVLLLPADQVRINEEVRHESLKDLGVHVLLDVKNVVMIRVLRVLQRVADRFPLAGEVVAGELVRPVHDLRHVPDRILRHVGDSLLETEFLEGHRNSHI